MVLACDVEVWVSELLSLSLLSNVTPIPLSTLVSFSRIIVFSVQVCRGRGRGRGRGEWRCFTAEANATPSEKVSSLSLSVSWWCTCVSCTVVVLVGMVGIYVEVTLVVVCFLLKETGVETDALR